MPAFIASEILMDHKRYGELARQEGYRLPLAVLSSNKGFYIGTADAQGPVSRESEEYFTTEALASDALSSGQWSQREDV